MKCDGCKAELDEYNHTQVRFRYSETDSDYTNDQVMRICNKCEDRLEEIIKEATESGNVSEGYDGSL